jgi:spore photoproduct lyase
MIQTRERKAEFVRLFDKTAPGVICPHFHELILSNGCPFNCDYCYLKLTFRGKKSPVLFSNDWSQVQRQLDASGDGVFSTGELADSLAVIPPLFNGAMEYFSSQTGKYLLLVTKSINTHALLKMGPCRQVVVSFSVNSPAAAKAYEHGAPAPAERLDAAKELVDAGWRVRIRLDPIIGEMDLHDYEDICRQIGQSQFERVTVGTLRQYPGLHNYAKTAPRLGLRKAPDGRMRYPVEDRVTIYRQIADWLGSRPALCKETEELWARLGWDFQGCNCTL